MSVAFALSASGPPVRCSFPKCVLNEFHDGDHEFAAPKTQPKPKLVHHCVVCGAGFVIYGDPAHPIPRTCGSQECLLHLARRESEPLPVFCPCPQREYPHELSVHALIRSESFHPQRKFRYPWSLCLSEREEMSTERRNG